MGFLIIGASQLDCPALYMGVLLRFPHQGSLLGTNRSKRLTQDQRSAAHPGYRALQNPARTQWTRRELKPHEETCMLSRSVWAIGEGLSALGNGPLRMICRRHWPVKSTVLEEPAPAQAE